MSMNMQVKIYIQENKIKSHEFLQHGEILIFHTWKQKKS